MRIKGHAGLQCSNCQLCNVKDIFPSFRSSSLRRRSPLRACGHTRIHACSSSEDISADFAARLRYQRSKKALPNLELNHIQAVERQLQVLKDNNSPYPDHGVEALYRFSNFDPFQRSLYFGRPLDLGQFERFRRIFHTPEYAVLLCHKSHKLCSSLQVSEVRWKQRVEICGEKPRDQGLFTFTMVQRVGGHSDGIWFCESLTTEKAPDIHT